jgi:hypothetical protein
LVAIVGILLVAIIGILLVAIVGFFYGYFINDYW